MAKSTAPRMKEAIERYQNSHEAWRMTKQRLDELVKIVNAYPSFNAAVTAVADTTWPKIDQVKAVYVLCGGKLRESYEEALVDAKLDAMIDSDNERAYDP
ncbi:hypothetical protein B0T26DRAFT_748558 [Lasiosphaeria miniovina]|uniref:Uncharacterized protein n=1 Tax=Lasiosphaeria miniovina TaxID=1954250 RepID=A0AA40B5Y1_9PEZI|nr:uncharacterized protein B0T26DRAFT_748558 [Lasiosphaeria miniovina]KAK0728324.1 hypothetical protein B0T26DRAFT_748558 [Lasiosphaeria miniovina]